MSQASSSEEFWRCINPDCPSPPDTVPLAAGRLFPICPFCRTPQSAADPGSTAGGTSDPVPKQPPDKGKELKQGTANLDISTSGPSKESSEAVTTPAQAERTVSMPVKNSGSDIEAENSRTSNNSSDSISQEEDASKDNPNSSSGHQVKDSPVKENEPPPLAPLPPGSGKVPMEQKSEDKPSEQTESEVIIIAESPPQTPGTAPSADQGDTTDLPHGGSDQRGGGTTTDPPHSSSDQGQGRTTDPPQGSSAPKGSDTSCEYCGKNLFDPALKECSGCKYRPVSGALLEEDTTQQTLDGNENAPQCEHCSEPLLEPDAVICTKCSRPHKENAMKRLLKKAKVDPPLNIPDPNTLPSKYPQVFGPTAATQTSSTQPKHQTADTGEESIKSDEDSGPTVGSFLQRRQLRSSSSFSKKDNHKPVETQASHTSDKPVGNTQHSTGSLRNQRKRSSSLSRENPSKHFKQAEGFYSDGEDPKPGSSKISKPLTHGDDGSTTTVPSSKGGDDPKVTPDSSGSGTTHNDTSTSQAAALPPSNQEEREGDFYMKPAIDDENSSNKKKKKKKKTKGEGGAQPESTDLQPSDIPADESLYKSLHGYNAPKTIEVVFHVIIPKPFWEWDANSRVYLRLGREDLGGWSQNVGDFRQREIDATYCEMSCSLRLNPEVLKLCIPYKYVVFTSKTKSKRCSHFENLGVVYSYTYRRHERVNRVLNVSHSKQVQALQGGSYHQFDTMAFPEDLKISSNWLEATAEKFKSGIKSFFGMEDKSDLKPPFKLDMRKMCLQFYLELYRFNKILAAAHFDDDMTIHKFVEQVHHVYSCLSNVSTTISGKPIPSEHISTYNSDAYHIRKWFAEWLVPLVKRVQEQRTEKQIQGSVCTIWCICQFRIAYNTPEVKSMSPILLRLLCAQQPSKEQQDQWKEYNYLRLFLQSEAHRKVVAEAVRNLCCASVAERTGALSMDWLCGIPLYSFLTGKYEPYDDVCSTSDAALAERWSEMKNKFKLGEIKKKFESEKSKYVKQYYPMVKSLIDLDPLTLQAFVYICPDADLSDLFARIPPNVCTAWLAYMMTNLGYRSDNMNEVAEWSVWISAIESNISAGTHPSALASPKALVDSAMSLLKRLTLYVRGISSHRVQVIVEAASLVCTILQNISVDKEKLVVELVEKMGTLLRDWISNEYVIGGKMFGCDVVRSGTHYGLSMGLSEIKIWEVLLSLECTDQRLHEEWQKMLHNLLSERVNNVPEYSAMQLLRLVERNGNEFLTNVVMNHAVKAAENLLSKPSHKQLEGFKEITEEDSKAFGRLLGAILEKRYPQLKESAENDWITLDVLLEWVVWPNYLKIIMQGNECLLYEGLSLACRVACVCALSKFRDICAQIQAAHVTVLDLQRISNTKELVERLCKAVEDKELTYSALSACLNQRVREFQFFQKRRRAYQTICEWIPDTTKIEGLSSLKNELKSDISNKKICELCQLKDGAPVLLCYQAAKPLEPFADHFDIMMNRSSNLFLHPLDIRLRRTVASRTDLAIAHVYSEIWQPVFDECRKLLDSLIDQSMTLSYVDTHLKKYDNLEPVVFNLAVGLSKCLKLTPDQTQLRRALWKINQYWKLCEYQNGAQVFLQLRNVLKLKGNFDLVENFSLQLSKTMKDQTLASIDSNLIDTGYFLEEIVNDRQKSECLQRFRDCQEIIIWLKEFTKSVNDIQGFVTVALATAAGGEGDLAHDRLSHLRTVGSGFASLIYEVKKTDDYRMLKERCKSLWEALEKNRNLPDLLVECKNDLEWYKQVKETQGSVETTSYGQMTNILKYGIYRVGFKKSAQTVHELITVTLTQRYQKLIKTKYTLDELRDLESKLVLICGNKADTRAEVDHYLNLLHIATRIAELYLDLQRAGDVTYSTAKLEFRCAVYDVRQSGVKELQFNDSFAKTRVSGLQEYTRVLDDQLVKWKKSVDTAREEYYELNYFTTLQLLELRRELGRLAQPTGATPVLKPSVLMLLKSVSPHVSSKVVSESLLAAQHEQEATPMDKEEPEEIDPQTPPTKSRVAGAVMDVNAPTPKRPVPASPKASPSAKPLLPTLTYEELDEKQKAVYITCINFYGYSASHVLRAFQECEQNPSVYDIEEWCEANEDESSTDQQEEPSQEFMEDVTYETDDSDTEEVDRATALALLKSGDNTAQGDLLPVSDSTPSIRTVERESIDENHTDVQELVEAGYDLQAAVEAMDQFRDVGRAMVFLDQQEREETGGTGDAGGYVRSVSREEVVEGGSEVDVKDIVQHRDSEASKSHLELDQLGRVLKAISNRLPGAVCQQRTFDAGLLKAGLPNLLVTSSDNVLRSVLALYTIDPDLPLPTQEEVLLCTDETSNEEVTLLWRRAIGDPHYLRVFCLAHAEKLSYQVCDAALRLLAELSQGRDDYRLVVICSKEDEDKSHIISRLHTFRRPVVPKLDERGCREYLKAHFTVPTDVEGSSQAATQCAAAVVDPDNSRVRVVSSARSGMGKSLYIKRRAEELITLTSNHDIHATIPIHGPVVTADTLLGFFDQHIEREAYTLYHLDIAPRVLREVDCLLFSLLILNGLSDSRGHVWRCQSSQMYMVEVTVPENTTNGEGFQTLKLLSLLPTVRCASPRVVEQQEQLGAGILGMDVQEFRGSTIQRVYQYLRRHAANQNLDTFSYRHGCVEGSNRDFLRIILSKCGIRDPSWSEVHHFSKFLDIQLHSCESSVFCDETLVGDVMSGLKGFVVKFMIRMSQDFSTPSLEGVLARENQEEAGAGENDQLEQYQIVRRRQWEQSSHPYIFFNDDCVSITFVGFRVTQTGDLINPGDLRVIESAIMRPQLYTGLRQNRVNFDEDYRGWSKETMITKIATVMGFDFLYDPDDTYVLTTDNLVKMLAIQMRFRCDIPVVIMGETGCGKTRLIRYMCDLARHGRDLKNMLILKIHGGITDQDVIKFVTAAEKAAETNKAADPRLSTVVFFDEANTTESIGLIKEIMCDRRMNGRAVSKDLKFIAACNPYRKHSEEMILKLETAGLGFYVRETRQLQKLGKIPLRQLVYRVLDLPPSMAPLVYDFGQLNTGTEHDYTSQIVKDHVNRHPQLRTESPAIIPAISTVLADSQKFMRDQKNECSFVSLRDVERAMIVFEYFYEKMSLFAPLMNERARRDYDELYAVDSEDEEEDIVRPPLPPPLNGLTRALLLSLSVCYHARLQDREPYEELISRSFRNPLGLPRGAQQFRDEIKWCQEGLLDEMELGSNIAKNAALRENVFMMAICIELRIPLFLVGKPGSSKSLAKSIIQDSMHGQGSKRPLLREFKQVHLFSYQCSQLSTPESVIEVFKSAERFQANQDIKQYVSVVVLDEVGLAEDSPSLPLKALHPLLEDGTEESGKDHQQQTVEREKRVAFIGISNWALDPAKMNRGVMVTRGVPGQEELQLSAHGICSTEDSDPVREQLQRHFASLSEAYMEICTNQERQFFGLRDYYSLIKMLYWMCKNSGGHPLTGPQLEHAIQRNFGGLESEKLKPLEVFQKWIGPMGNTEDAEELHTVMNPDCSRLGLIKTSLKTKDTTWHGENRYLLFLTENYAALDILKHYLNVGSEGAEDDDITSQPYILFGSSFPKDKEYTQVCRNINQIKICMETGRTVILLNLENLYESLYDVLNQYYMRYGGVRYVDLGLQTHRVKCRVHDNFKLILIAEKDTVYKKFPTPLINRLEKHFVLTSSVLETWQRSALREFENWIQAFSKTSDSRGNQFKEAHAFIGYQNDTPAAVIFQATNMLKRLVDRPGEQECYRLQRAGILGDDLYDLSEVDKESPQWTQAVLRLSQFLLLQTAADDALIRLQKSNFSKDEVEVFLNLYYKHQHHRSIREFLEYECSREDHEVFMQVTTHSPLMTQEELKAVAESFSMGFAHFDLHEFDTELDFSNKIGPKFLREENQVQPFLVVVQCDSGHLNCDLIACARYRVCDEAIKAKAKNKIRDRNDITHILFVIRLPQQEIKSQFVGFQGDPWISVHIDDLRPTSEATVIPEEALTAKISELFIGDFDEPEAHFQPEEEVRSESGEPREEREMSISAEHDDSETDSFRDDMSEDSHSSYEDEPYSPHLPNVASMERVADMDSEHSQPLFTPSEPVFKDNAHLPGSLEQPSYMEVEDIEDMTSEQLYAPEELAYNKVPLPTVEDMQTEESAAPRSSEDFQPPIPSLTEHATPTPTAPISSATTPIPLATPIVPPPVSMEIESGAGVVQSPKIGAGVEEEALDEVPPEGVRESKPFHAQHRRLLGCVQAAVSMLKDSEGNRSMVRIQKLMHLIPKTTPDQLADAQFYALLVQFIHRALKKREEVRVDERDWVLMEAMSGRKLQSGGTFRNVLARRIDEVVTPFFAELIAHIDQNRNLDLLEAKRQTTPISLFWLEMFRLTGGRIDFSSLAKGKTDIKTHFPCQLPFSWFVREEVEAQRANVLGASHSLQHNLNTIVDALGQTEVGDILRRVSEENVPDFYKWYLHDFVRYVHQSGNKSDLGIIEYKLISDALDAMTHHPDLCSMDGHESLPRRIVALHLVHSRCSTEVLQFGQLVLHRPGILQSLSNPNQQHLLVDTDGDFSLHLMAVQRVLESDQEDDPTNQTLAGLNPPLHKQKQSDVTQNILRWLNHVRLSQNVIDTILRSSVKTEAAVRARLTWLRVRALQIFAEKVYIPHSSVSGMVFIIRRLEMTLKRHSDFLKRETLDGVKLLLVNMFNKVKVNETGKAKITRDCNRFFIEVVSSLCFGGREAPEPDLVKVLLDTVLHDTETSKLSPYKEPDKTPTIRSFLLQLLLEKEPDQVEGCLRDYFDRSLRVIGDQPDQGLCLLCIQCFEDAHRKRMSTDHSPGEVAEILEESYLSLVEHTHANEPQVSLQYLQSVAGVRFGLSVVAEQLRNGRVDDRLLRVTTDLCVDHRVNVIDPTGRVDTTGPVLYLLKLLIRQFGYPCLKAVCEAHHWVVPEDLRRGDEDEKSMDPFTLYGKGYTDMRSAVNSVVFAKKTDELTACVQGGYEPSLLTFALYQKVTLSRVSRVPAKQVQDEALQTLNTFIQESAGLSPDVMHVLRLLLSNQQGGPLAQLTASPHQPSLCRTLSGIVVHCVAVILSRTNVDLLQPFLNMLTNPTAIENAYLPTMAEDLLQEVRRAGGTFYECPNGHPYLVGECGRPVEEKYCRECGAKIGGVNHRLTATNRTARVNDATKTGYDLGHPERRSLNPERERDLSAPAVCVVRAIMHSAFVWAACNNQEELVELAKVTKGQVPPGGLPEFFWRHLERDLECLGRCTGRGVDECAMIVHLVLQNILTRNAQTSAIAANVKHLQSKDARKHWEKLFSVTYVEPVLTSLDAAIAGALDIVANDDQQEHDQLFYLAYEKVKVDESKLQAHLWTFRQQINLEHLHRDVQAASTRRKIPVLDAFLQAEPSLRATQYLPDIVKLQRFLFDMYDKRLEKGKAETHTIRDFLREVKERFNENAKNECQERIESLSKAWALVRHKLKTHHRLPVEEEYLLPEITPKTHLVYLVPTTMKEGRCTTALVDYLVITHNDFIEHCRTAVNKGAGSAAAVWREHKVPITHLHLCHMLEYEQHLQSIILSHCHYSLTVGQGQKIEYDHQGLEKHLLDRFIYGKPVIQVDIPNVAYRKDIYTVESFLEIRRKVKPQVPLDQRVQQDIVSELRTPDKLRESLDVVEIVLGLLSSGGGNPKFSLKQFIDSRRMGRKPFSAKAKEHCTLGHIISLWETISVELANQLWESGQEPFEAIPDGYTEELNGDQRSELEKCLRTFDLGLLSGVLFEFIEVHVKQLTDQSLKDYELVDALDDYWGMTEQTYTRETVMRGFPSSITVDQAVATWKSVAYYKVKGRLA